MATTEQVNRELAKMGADPLTASEAAALSEALTYDEAIELAAKLSTGRTAGRDGAHRRSWHGSRARG